MPLSGYIMHEYKLVIPLPEVLEQKIHQIRKISEYNINTNRIPAGRTLPY
ncbi:MAG: hypothetical protein ACK458_08930 [Sphingobacteriales bacterium]|jgi:hypothetical protein